MSQQIEKESEEVFCLECKVSLTGGRTLTLEIDKRCQIFYSLCTPLEETYYQKLLNAPETANPPWEKIFSDAHLKGEDRQWLMQMLLNFTKLVDTCEQKLTTNSTKYPLSSYS